MHIRRERRDDDPLVRVRHEDHIKRCADLAFRRREARLFHIRAFTHEQQNALAPVFADPCQIHHLAADRGDVQLEVARVEDGPLRCAYRDHAGVRDRVVHPDEFAFEHTKLQDRSRFYRYQLPFPKQTMLRQLAFQDTKREPRAVYRNVQLLE